MFDYETLIQQLSDLREESYAAFSGKLLPGTSSIWGIRLPKLRKVAKQIKKMDIQDYFQKVKHEFFEETLLMGFVIGTMDESKYSFEEIQERVEAYLPYIHNWSVCDSFCSSLKIAKSQPEMMFTFLKRVFDENIREDVTNGQLNEQAYVEKAQEYIIRFVIVMWLNYFIKDDYVDEVLCNLFKLKSDQYYVNMAVAWCYSMVYVSYPKKIEKYLNNNLKIQTNMSASDLFVHNKTISKICESYQVEEERKMEIRSLKIKGNK